MNARKPPKIVRHPEKFTADDARVITRLFLPGDEERVRSVVGRVMSLDENDVAALLDDVLARFQSRHRNLAAVFRRNYERIIPSLDHVPEVSAIRAMLIGAYFTHEYSFESAALFNPSIVAHPDQTGMPEGAVRFLMSLRATGEGHVSSIVFRSGSLDAHGAITIDPLEGFARGLEPVSDQRHAKDDFFHKLIEMGAYDNTAGMLLDRLDDFFTYAELNQAIARAAAEAPDTEHLDQTAGNMRWLARSNYMLVIPRHEPASEIVIFPHSENEIRGIEDMRLVRFVDDDAGVRYYGTYTAYNGFRTLPQLMQTPDFHEIHITIMSGKFVHNKGMALFPRRIRGWYMMVARQDGERLYLLRSKNVRFWNEGTLLQAPKYPWEFVQIGNCGSPLETQRGWLLLTHGVGPMREYCIGATLLDLDAPSRIIGQTRTPLIAPTADEREGYVPNVVYTCGAMIHQQQLYIPYAMADSATGIATLNLNDLLDYLCP
jgi:predicted GH43/DUF377 family glycosyl hydrolase